MPNKKPFAEVQKQIYLLNDLILADMVCGSANLAEETLYFNRRLYNLKYWFDRISWANKRRYILALVEDLRSAWALSFLLKSLWNCRPKDAVHSACKPPFLSVYDRTPMDHNRTAIPASTLGQVMTTDRKWFHTLEPEPQAQVLAELLTIAGGPIMWEVLRRGQHIYEQLREYQFRNLLQCTVVEEENEDLDEPPQPPPRNGSKLKAASSHAYMTVEMSLLAKAQKELESKLEAWNLIVKDMRETQKLEELEMTYLDGSKRNVWKVNRTQPESYETVDMLQLFPSYIAKKIFTYLPLDEFSEYVKVNRYWAYIIDELKAEWAVRNKLNSDMLILRENMLKHDLSLELLAMPVPTTGVESTAPSMAPSYPRTGRLPTMSFRASERSAGGVSFRHVLVDKLRPAHKITSKPIRKLSDLERRLETRGAADEDTWLQCRNVLRFTKGRHPKKKPFEGVLRLGNMHFPCPLMKHTLTLPLAQALTQDPSRPTHGGSKFRPKLPYDINVGKPEQTRRRMNLWSRNFSSLYKVMKVASYQSPLLRNKPE